MEKEEKAFAKWLKEHKRQLLIAGVSVSAIIAIVIGAKNHQAIEALLESLKKKIESVPEKAVNTGMAVEVVREAPVIPLPTNDKAIITRIPHEVREHLRNLPKGHKPSAEKLALAAERGIELLPAQTIVEAYSTGGCAV